MVRCGGGADLHGSQYLLTLNSWFVLQKRGNDEIGVFHADAGSKLLFSDSIFVDGLECAFERKTGDRALANCFKLY